MRAIVVALSAVSLFNAPPARATGDQGGAVPPPAPDLPTARAHPPADNDLPITGSHDTVIAPPATGDGGSVRPPPAMDGAILRPPPTTDAPTPR